MEYLKVILCGLFSTLISLLIVFLVSNQGVVAIDNFEASPELKEMYDDLTGENLEEYRERYREEVEQAILQLREENSHFPNNMYAYKAASWYLTWLPWFLLGIITRKISYKKQIYVFVIPFMLTIFQFFWWRELLFFMLSYYLGSYLRIYKQSLRWSKND